jgi:L-ascorbate metabolism protein UlaG (beta-lactamase superfamily)
LVTGSPVPFINKPFPCADVYKTPDIPAIDDVIITHDHYDHLDYFTVKALRNRI